MIKELNVTVPETAVEALREMKVGKLELIASAAQSWRQFEDTKWQYQDHPEILNIIETAITLLRYEIIVTARKVK